MGFPEIHADTKVNSHTEALQIEIDHLRTIISEQREIIDMLKSVNSKYYYALQKIEDHCAWNDEAWRIANEALDIIQP